MPALVFLLQFEKRIDSRASSIFKLRQKKLKTDIWFLVAVWCNITIADFGKFDPKPSSDQNM